MGDFVTWMLVTPGMIWLYLALVGLALFLVVRKDDCERDEARVKTFGHALAAVVRSCAVSNSGDALHSATWQLCAGIEGLDYEEIKPLVVVASVAQRARGDDLAAFDVLGEEARHLVRGAVGWPEEATEIVNLFEVDPVDHERIAKLCGEASSQTLAAMQLVMEYAIVAKYAEALAAQRKSRDAFDHTAKTGWNAVWFGLGRGVRWLWQRWGRIFCFTVGGLMVLTGSSSGYSGGNMSQVVAGGALLLTGVGLTAIKKLQPRT